MLEAIKQVLGMGPKVDLPELIANGAVILDVRSRGEYGGGHIRGSVNMPLPEMRETIKKKYKNLDQPIVTCCATGMRSSVAKGELQSLGYTHVHNGGGWASLLEKIKNKKG